MRMRTKEIVLALLQMLKLRNSEAVDSLTL